MRWNGRGVCIDPWLIWSEMILSMRESVTGYFDGSGAIEGKGMRMDRLNTAKSSVYCLSPSAHTKSGSG